jgi:carbamoyltransferase
MASVLGLTNCHDASVSVVVDGKPVLVFEKERFAREKHAGGRLDGIVGAAAAAAGLSVGDVDCVAIVPPIVHRGEKDWKLREGNLPKQVGDVRTGVAEIDGARVPAVLVPHHFAHAAYAYYSSGVSTSDVLTIDAGGGECDASVSHWADGRLAWIEPLDGFHLGTLWAVLSRALFGDPHAAGKVMGLAAYGATTYRELLDRTVQGSGLDTTVGSAWVDPEILGLPRLGKPDWRAREWRDLSTSLQALTDDIVLDLADALHRRSGAPHFAFAGGVALNGYTNTVVTINSKYADCFFPNAPHDGGVSLGAAQFAAASAGDFRAAGRLSPFLGVHPDGSIDASEPTVWPLAEIADKLQDGKTVGTVLGRAEIGPRALGNRSILSGVDHAWIVPYLNTQVKSREVFRPVAPVIRAEDAHLFLDDPRSCNELMTQIGRLRAGSGSS